MKSYDIVIIGGGAAGLAAAVKSTELGCKCLVLDRENQLGGILNQCIQKGYGINIFNEDITGCEYAQRFINEFNNLGVECELDAMVIEINDQREIKFINPKGIHKVKAKAVIFAAGCREIPKVSLDIPGSRLAGVLTAGTIQNLVNIYGYLPGKEIVVYGTSNLSFSTVERLVLEGASVKAMVEENKNIKCDRKNLLQCVEDFDINIITSHVIKSIAGVDRVQGVTICKIDASGKPIEGSEQYISCDTLMISVDLKPENEVLRDTLEISEEELMQVNEKMQTSKEWIFACGDVIRKHNSADEVSLEGYKAAEAAAEYAAKC
ncbi:FAD-dependent oxidoreductase [Clostridium sp. 19966]|uniref:NAD(P)/FAD-dependent oxidoreductase n=1 Tax=Clostridium sp. 19966 TaxID=2768166 RepID=UPI0028DE5DBA|nr:FAD-dependent oxidoreductase [Clostridium sp. 19966]MDT8715519.1 FAD-dependent oxidoreductase [Clostridium sp. 19966]